MACPWKYFICKQCSLDQDESHRGYCVLCCWEQMTKRWPVSSLWKQKWKCEGLIDANFYQPHLCEACTEYDGLYAENSECPFSAAIFNSYLQLLNCPNIVFFLVYVWQQRINPVAKEDGTGTSSSKDMFKEECEYYTCLSTCATWTSG